MIVTFSNASAAEFKKRIDDSLSRLMAQNPDSAYLSRQRVKLQNADISTIDAFCIKLARENFQILDISPDAGICDDHTDRADTSAGHRPGHELRLRS